MRAMTREEKIKYVELALRVAEVKLTIKDIKIIVSIVELIEEKGGEADIKDILNVIQHIDR